MYYNINTLNEIVSSLDKINNSLNQTNWLEILTTVLASFTISILTVFLTLRYERKSKKLSNQENINLLFLSSLHEALTEHRSILFWTPTEIESDFISFCRLSGINNFEETSSINLNMNELQSSESKKYLNSISNNLFKYANELSYLYLFDPLLDSIVESSVLYKDLILLRDQIKTFEREVFGLGFLLQDSLVNARIYNYPQHIMEKLDKKRDLNQFLSDYNKVLKSDKTFKELYDRLIRLSKINLYQDI